MLFLQILASLSFRDAHLHTETADGCESRNPSGDIPPVYIPNPTQKLEHLLPLGDEFAGITRKLALHIDVSVACADDKSVELLFAQPALPKFIRPVQRNFLKNARVLGRGAEVFDDREVF